MLATKHVIAYPMHEHEWDAAAAIQQTQVTDSFVIGNIEEEELEDLRARGLVVDELPDAGATTAAMARRELQAATGIEGWQPDEDMPAPAPKPGETVNWIVSLDGPLAEDRRNAVNATGMVLQEYVPNFSYVAAGTPEQADEMINLSFVQDVVRYGAKVTGPIELTKSAAADHRPTPGAGGAARATRLSVIGHPHRLGGAPGCRSPCSLGRTTGNHPDAGRKWDLWLANESARPEVLNWLAGNDVDVVGSGGRKVRIALSAEAAELAQQIATLPGVLNMIEHVPPKLFNDVARQILGVASANPGQEHEIPGRGTDHRCGGHGPGRYPSGLRRGSSAWSRWGPRQPQDNPNGHGTHVAGSRAGRRCRFRPRLPRRGTEGQAVLSILDGLAGWSSSGIPVSLESLFEPAYQAGARGPQQQLGRRRFVPPTQWTPWMWTTTWQNGGTCSSSPRAMKAQQRSTLTPVMDSWTGFPLVPPRPARTRLPWARPAQQPEHRRLVWPDLRKVLAP